MIEEGFIYWIRKSQEVWCLLSLEMDMVSRFQILKDKVCISHSASLDKGIYPTMLSPAISKS